MIIDSPEFLRRCAEAYYRREGYAPVGVRALDTREFYDLLRSSGWSPQWSDAHAGVWVPSWMPPILMVAAGDTASPDPARVERLVAEVARVMWRPASDATIEAVRASMGWLPLPAWRVRHPLELDILTTLDGHDAIRAHLESIGVRVVTDYP